MPAWLCKIWRFIANILGKIVDFVLEVLSKIIDFVVEAVDSLVSGGLGSLLLVAGVGFLVYLLLRSGKGETDVTVFGGSR